MQDTRGSAQHLTSVSLSFILDEWPGLGAPDNTAFLGFGTHWGYQLAQIKAQRGQGLAWVSGTRLLWRKSQSPTLPQGQSYTLTAQPGAVCPWGCGKEGRCHSQGWECVSAAAAPLLSLWSITTACSMQTLIRAKFTINKTTELTWRHGCPPICE